MADINMISLIYVMLVLLVIFIITAPLLTHAVKIDLPKAASQPRSLLSIAKLNMARSRTARRFCRWIRMAQMPFGFSGGFWPMSLPLFQASRF